MEHETIWDLTGFKTGEYSFNIAADTYFEDFLNKGLHIFEEDPIEDVAVLKVPAIFKSRLEDYGLWQIWFESINEIKSDIKENEKEKERFVNHLNCLFKENTSDSLTLAFKIVIEKAVSNNFKQDIPFYTKLFYIVQDSVFKNI